MSAAYTPGQEVYDIHGRAGAYVARVSGGHIVQPIYEQDEDEEPVFDAAQTWPQVFSKPPTEKLQAEVAVLEKKADAARAELASISAERYALDKEHRERLERLKKYAHLSRIDDYIEGRITHFVVSEQYGSSVAVRTFDQVMKDTERSSNYVNLLVLRGTDSSYISNDWQRRELYDSHWCITGDREKSWVIPCTSLEEATEKARARTLELFEEARKTPHFANGGSSVVSLAASAKALGMEIPADIAAVAKAYSERQANEQIARAQAEFDRATASVASAQAALQKARSV